MTVWQNEKRARQLIEFDDLSYRDGGSPTDIDAVFECHGWFWVLFEVKHKDKPMPRGQMLCLERAVEDFEKAGKRAVAMVVEHSVDDPEKAVKLAKCTVRAAYRNKQWYQMDNSVSVKNALDKIVREWSK